MLIVPFANPIGPQSGDGGDGVVLGALPRVYQTTGLSQVHLLAFTRVYRGNADASGNVAWSNVTTAANNDAAGDVSLFDATNPTADRMCIDMSPGDAINGISLLVSTAAAGLTGAPAAIVRYKGTDNTWKTAQAVVTPLLTSTGLKKISFTAISYDDVAPTDDLLNPVSNPQARCLFVEFSGISAVTTAPLFSRVFKSILPSAGARGLNLTAITSQGANPDFSAAQDSVLPVAGDLSLFGFDEKPVRLFPTIYRPSDAAHAKEWCYSRAADFVAMPAGSMGDQSALLGTAGVASGVSWDGASGVAGVQEFFEPDALPAGELTTWPDGAGAANSLTQATQASRPTVVANAYNGQAAVRFDGADDWLGLPINRADVRCVFAVVREDVAAGNVKFLFGDDVNYHFHRDQNATKYMIGSGASAFVTGGTARVNGAVVNMQATPYPTTLGIVSFETTGNVEIGNLGNDRNIANRNWQGDICEVIILNAVPSQASRESIEGYLAWKYGLQASLPSSHPYRHFAQGTTPLPHQVSIVPPADWAKQSMTDTAGTAHNRYWIGLRTTADAANPVLPLNLTIRAQIGKGSGSAGVPAPATEVYTRATVAARDPASADSTLVVLNITTGAQAVVVVPSGATVASSAISLPVAKGDEIAVTQPFGHPSVNLADGMLLLA